jgi:hypothetical protein
MVGNRNRFKFEFVGGFARALLAFFALSPPAAELPKGGAYDPKAVTGKIFSKASDESLSLMENSREAGEKT